MTPDIIRAHRHSSYHREELLASETCGCFYCCNIFPPAEIWEWTDKCRRIGHLAICPRCGIDSVIGSESGYPITREFLEQMKVRWFGPD